MNVTYDEIIQNIRDILEKKGFKQGFIAEKAGFTPQEFSYILTSNETEKKRKLLRVEHMKPIADALGVTLNDLYKKPKTPQAV